MPRFFIEAELNVETTVELTETVFHHWVKVLRAQVGETATFSRASREFSAPGILDTTFLPLPIAAKIAS